MFAFRDITVDIKGKKILDGVFGEIPRGSMMAVMGPSGAGKTTLFNSLIGMTKLDAGQVFYKNHSFRKQDRRKTAYVLQSDCFYCSLTLAQTLEFYAQVTLPERFTDQQRKERIQDVVDFLELTKCLDTKIGNAFNGGLSGGEKKRASIACSLLRDPEILLLDEPTSSLDSSLAYNIMVKLEDWAKTRNRVVLATIHQPSTQIFHLFRSLLLLANGQVTYFGQTSGLLPYLKDIGINCPSNWNPADFILTLVQDSSPSLPTLLANIKPVKDQFTLRWPGNAVVDGNDWSLNKAFDMTELGIESVKVTMQSESVVSEDIPEKSFEKYPASYWRQYAALTKRYFVTSRSRILSPVHLFESVFISAIIGCISAGLQFNDVNVQDRLGLIFISIVVWSFDSVMDSVRSFPEHRMIVKKERDAHMYRTSAFMLALQTADIPMIVVLPSIFFAVVFWSARLSQGIGFLYGLLVIIFNCITIQGFGNAMGILFEDPNWSITSALTFMISTMLCAGFFTSHFPVWISWIRYFSVVNYSYALMLQVVLPYSHDVVCNPSPTYLSSPRCINATSYQMVDILQDMTYQIPMWANIAVMFAILLAFRLAAYILLRVCMKPRDHSR